MAQFPTFKFLSLIPTLHESAVIMDSPVVDSTPASPVVKPVDKTRRSSSTASAASMPGDVVSQVQKQQFLKLGN